MTSSSQLVFTGSYGAGDQPGLRAFAFDPATGVLTARGEHYGIAFPSFVAVHPSGHWLYAVNETSVASHGTAGHVHALSFERAGGVVTFTPLNVQNSGGDLPCHLRMDPFGKSLIVTNYGTGTASALPVQADGSLGEISALVSHQGRGPHPDRQDSPHAHSAIFTPDGEFAIVADLGMDTLVIYRYTDGRMTKVREVPTTPGAGPRHLAFHPNGRVLYVANELSGTLSAYDYLAGELGERETLATLPEDAPENLVADLHVAPAGDRVYVSNRGHDSLAVYSATSEGALRLLTFADCGGNWPRNFALSPDGRFILVANQYSGEVVSLPIQPGAGEIGEPAARTAVPDVACVVFAAGPNLEYNEVGGVERPVHSDMHRRAS
jgi:6-phosphogluconolactonase